MTASDATMSDMDVSYFATECNEAVVALALEPQEGNEEGAAKLAATDVLKDWPCPLCERTHDIPRVTAEEYEQMTSDDWRSE